MGELLNLKALRKWRSVGIVIISERRIRRIADLKSFRRIAGLCENIESEANDPKLLDRVRVLCVVLKAVLHFTENLGLYPIEDVPSSEGIVTGRFQQPVGSAVNGHDEQVRASSVAVPHFTENLGLPSNEDVPPSEGIVTGRFQQPVRSTINGHDICELLGKYKKRELAVIYLVLEAASFLLDIYGKRKWSILLAALILSAIGFVITISTHSWTMRRTRATTRMHLQKRQLMVLDISFSLAQLIVTLINFILAKKGVKKSFNSPVFPLVFAIIAAMFAFKYEGEVSDSSGLASSLMASASDLPLQNLQVPMPITTRYEDPGANGSMPMLATVTIDDSKKQYPYIPMSVAYFRSLTMRSFDSDSS